MLIPSTRVCPVCKGADMFLRKQHAEDEAAKKQQGTDPSPLTPQPGDGRKTYLRSATPQEIAAAKKQRPERG